MATLTDRSQIPWNQNSLDNLTEFLEEGEGRLVGALISRPIAGDTLLEILKDRLPNLAIVHAPTEDLADLSGWMFDRRNTAAIIVIRADERLIFSSEQAESAWWKQLNLQRESLAPGKLRVLFLLSAYRLLMFQRYADDLFDWVHLFRFPEAKTEQVKFLIPLPAHVSDRKEFRELRDLILSRGGNRVCVYGPPGCGKSTLCSLVMHDPAVAERHPEALVHLLRNPNEPLTRYQVRLARLFDPGATDIKDADFGLALLKTLLRDTAALIVLDGVEDERESSLLDAIGSQGTMVFVRSDGAPLALSQINSSVGLGAFP